MKTIPSLTFFRNSAFPSAILLLVGLSIAPAYALDITGDTVTTNLTVKGSSITLNNNHATRSSQLRFNSTSRVSSFWLDAPGTWIWSHGTTPIDVMSLDSGNVLSLYDPGTTSVNPTIILNPGNPGNTPAIAPYITVGGNLVLTASNAQSILNSQGYLRVVGGVVSLPSTTLSTSSTTGALTVAGGIGVVRDSWVNGIRVGRGAGNVASNTSLGAGTLNSNLTGGTANTAFGFDALFGNITGSGNTATGHLSLRSNAYGWYNTALGSQSLRYQLNGSRNVAVGFDAASLVESGAILSNASDSIFIGARTRAKTDSAQNSIVIGYNAIGDGSNTTVIGNNATLSTRLEGETQVEALNVAGDTVLEGSVILAAPQGDISMGIYQ